MSDAILRDFIFTIEKQEARIAILEKALNDIANKTAHAHPMSSFADLWRIARAALEGWENGN